MTFSLVSDIDLMAQNIKTKILEIDNQIQVILYSPTLEIIRGKFGINILPTSVITREFTGVRTLPDYMFTLSIYRTLDAEEEYPAIWLSLLNLMNEISNKLYNNLVDGVSTAMINVEFNDDIVAARDRLINGTIICTYKKYASR